MAKREITRRKFIREAGTAGAAMAFTIVPRHVLGHGYRAPSDTLNIACIGVGGRGREDVKSVASENIYALCDVDEVSAADSYSAHPKAKRYTDYRELLEKEAKHIDAVVVATPDHTHAAVARLAMKAGKHVYCEKPLARTLDEVRGLADLAKTTKVATQM
ncbi:MAG TPA: Gfo/Idh/MocA family oxidoreductase, partial [Gemmatimonadales bacterium]|nr:Gfo/Idh/MocA family oxidoreductase [Gemmatimonadales bacterium]